MRLVALLVVLAVGAAAPAGALQTPPTKPAKHKPAKHKHKPAKKKPHKKKPGAKKPAAVPTPAGDTPVAPAPAETPGAPAGDPADGAGPAPVTPAAPLSHVLGVTEKEFTLLLTRTTVAAGALSIEVLNKGEDPHDLRLDRVDGGLVFQWDELASLERFPAQSILVTPGTYRLYCTIAGHAELGMDKQVTVQAG